MSSKIRVGLVYGGKSGEHDVSLQTAYAVINAFDFTKYEIQPFYINKHGEWKAGTALNGPVDEIESLKLEYGVEHPSSEQLVAEQKAIQPMLAFALKKEKQSPHPLDVVFPLLHGTYGEDGTVQGLLEMAGLPYVGAGVLASAVGMDKVLMKKVFAEAGLPQCLYRHFTRKQWQRDQSYYLMEIEISLGYPCFIKPANLGSSVGISKATNKQELLEGIENALRYDRKVIIEEHVDAREIEFSVLGNELPEVSVPGEIVASNDFYDYRAKYVDGTSQMLIPADLPEDTISEMQLMAIRAFEAIDGSGLSRVDFFIRKDSGEILLNEINTMPGFTPYSMYPLLWKHSGKSYAELLDRLIELAMERYNEKQDISFD